VPPRCTRSPRPRRSGCVPCRLRALSTCTLTVSPDRIAGRRAAVPFHHLNRVHVAAPSGSQSFSSRFRAASRSGLSRQCSAPPLPASPPAGSRQWLPDISTSGTFKLRPPLPGRKARAAGHESQAGRRELRKVQQPRLTVVRHRVFVADHSGSVPRDGIQNHRAGSSPPVEERSRRSETSSVTRSRHAAVDAFVAPAQHDDALEPAQPLSSPPA